MADQTIINKNVKKQTSKDEIVTSKDEVVKKQTDFIESFQKMMGFENNQMINAIVNPLNNRVIITENKIKELELKLDTNCKENAELRTKVEAYNKTTNDSKAILEKKHHDVEQVLKAIGNICKGG